MADDSGLDKTEDPTAKRIADARKKGQIPRSKELDTFVSLMVAAIMLFFLGRGIVDGLVGLMQQQFQLSREIIFSNKSITIYFAQVLLDGMLLIIPFALILTLTALLRPMLMGGWNFSMESMQPKLSKFSIIKGVKRMFGLQGIVELFKAILKTTLVLFVAKILFNTYLPEFMGLMDEPIKSAIFHAADIIMLCLIILSSTLILLVIVDVPYQLWKYKKDMMMTKQEVKDENKQSEGDPLVKGRMRQMQMEMSQGRMMNDVPEADVIVTNPTHFAIALKYDQSNAGAPILLAKGTDLVAAHIRNIGTGADVPLVAVPTLARALFYSTEVGDEIPSGLFQVVAQVLAYVYQLKIAEKKNSMKPRFPENLEIPNEFRTQ